MEERGYIDRVQSVLTVEKATKFATEWTKAKEELRRKLNVKGRNIANRP